MTRAIEPLFGRPALHRSRGSSAPHDEEGLPAERRPPSLAARRRPASHSQLSLVAKAAVLCGVAAATPSVPRGAQQWRHAEEASERRPSRQLSATCPSGEQPLVWVVKKGNQTGYLTATYRTPASTISTIPTDVSDAIGCADMGYFELACSMAKGGGFGSYFAHCKSYPISDPKDAVALRLPAQTVRSLQEVLENVAKAPPAGCTQAAQELLAEARQLNSTQFVTTLETLYIHALELLDPEVCKLKEGAGSQQGTTEHGDMLRGALQNVGKPVWGLVDPDYHCKFYQGNTYQQDEALAQRMLQTLSQTTWLTQAATVQQSISNVLRCGDLDELETLREGMNVDLPWMRPGQLHERNALLAEGISTAFVDNLDKTLFIAVQIQHLLNGTGLASVQQQLQDNHGIEATRLTGNQRLQCSKSSYQARGAKARGICWLPLDRRQPNSCWAFRRELKVKTRAANMSHYGRKLDRTDCHDCVMSNTSCSCKLEWTNTTGFRDLCENMEVEGERGVIWHLDLTRNPGSHRIGPGKAEKVVEDRYQLCKAASCDSEYQAEMALRKWYATDPDLGLGRVTIHVPGEGTGEHGLGWSTTSWLLAGAAVLALIATLIGLFFLPKARRASFNLGSRGGVRRGSGHSSHSDYERTEQSDAEDSRSYEELKPLAAGQQHDSPEPPQYQQQQQDRDFQFQQQQQYQQEQHQMSPSYEQRQQSAFDASQGQMRDLRVAQPQGEPFQAQPRQLSVPAPVPSMQMDMGGGSLIQQAMAMRSQLADSGSKAVHEMQMFGSPGSPGSPAGSAGMPFGSASPPMPPPMVPTPVVSRSGAYEVPPPAVSSSAAAFNLQSQPSMAIPVGQGIQQYFPPPASTGAFGQAGLGQPRSPSGFRQMAAPPHSPGGGCNVSSMVLNAQFDAADHNRDGVVTREEFNRAFGAMNAPQAFPSQSLPSGQSMFRPGY